METLYNIIIKIADALLPLGNWMGAKMRLFSEGRKKIFPLLRSKLDPNDKTIWIHAASLGEFEQAVPIIERLKAELPQYKILVTFFSPSGYEIKKDSPLADLVTYLPLDTRKNANKFIELVQPEWALFIKYEIWPNFLYELNKRKIKTLLVSGNFRPDQIFFKSHGKWMHKYLHSFNYFFVQNNKSMDLLHTIGITNVSVSGDTRFDRVSSQIEQNNHLEFIDEFKNNTLCLVAGSTWPEDDQLLMDFINQRKDIKVVIAPHTIKKTKVKDLKERFERKAVLFSEKEDIQLQEFDILIIDTIGLLTKIYSYADIAYVGGAAGMTGLHNILEPATFGVPIVIGKNFERFPEAKQLRKLAGLFSVSTSEEATSILNKLADDKNLRTRTGLISEHFVQSNLGATKIVMEYIHNNS